MSSEEDNNVNDDPLFWKILKSPPKKEYCWAIEKMITLDRMRQIAEEKNKNEKQ